MGNTPASGLGLQHAPADEYGAAFRGFLTCGTVSCRILLERSRTARRAKIVGLALVVGSEVGGLRIDAHATDGIDGGGIERICHWYAPLHRWLIGRCYGGDWVMLFVEDGLDLIEVHAIRIVLQLDVLGGDVDRQTADACNRIQGVGDGAITVFAGDIGNNEDSLGHSDSFQSMPLAFTRRWMC